MLQTLRKLISRLFCCQAQQDSSDACVEVTAVTATVEVSKKPNTKPHASAAPKIFIKQYHKVITHDVVAKEAVCITSDIAVLGNADLSGGDTCITGNVLVAGDVSIKGSPCITGTVIILGKALVKGQACVTGDCFVHGDLTVRGKLEVGGKLCAFGSKDIQPE